jgi:drug/metabolite transporter (DMT)-like permease
MVMELWIPVTLFAAFMQTLRSALQKHIKGKLSTGGAAYVRFCYALPFALITAVLVFTIGGYDIPTPNRVFLLYCLLGGIAQIVFTFLLVYLFSLRNFAVGTTYSKTEVMQVAIMGFVLLGDTITVAGVIAIGIGMIGVMALAVAQTAISWKNLITSLFERSTLIGLLSGGFLGASVVLFRGATLSLEEGDVVARASFTLAVALVMQTLIMGGYLVLKEAGQLRAVVRHWRPGLTVGTAGFLGSAGWFVALTLQNAAYVRAVGQVELVFTFIASIFFFNERTRPVEFVGISLIIASILMLVLYG